MQFSINRVRGGCALEKQEDEAITTILRILSSKGVDLKGISVEKTKSYVKLMVGRCETTFCRLKVTGQAFYIGFRIRGDIGRLVEKDQRFNEVKYDWKNLVKVPIADLQNIEAFSQEIYESYKYVEETEETEEEYQASLDKIRTLAELRREGKRDYEINKMFPAPPNLIESSRITKVPKYNEKMHEDMKNVLLGIEDKIGRIVSNFQRKHSGLSEDDVAAKIALKGLDYEKSKDEKNCVLHYEAALSLYIAAPHYYKKLASIYRRCGLFYEEMRIIDAALECLSRRSTHYIWFQQKKQAVEQIINLLENSSK